MSSPKFYYVLVHDACNDGEHSEVLGVEREWESHDEVIPANEARKLKAKAEKLFGKPIEWKLSDGFEEHCQRTYHNSEAPEHYMYHEDQNGYDGPYHIYRVKEC